jgi:hypothetical protein
MQAPVSTFARLQMLAQPRELRRKFACKNWPDFGRPLIVGKSNLRARTILDARGRSPHCDQVARSLLGGGTGGRYPGLLLRSGARQQRPGAPGAETRHA